MMNDFSEIPAESEFRSEMEIEPEEFDDLNENDELVDDEPNDDMDGDFDSAMTSAGFGTDEDYYHDTPIGDMYGGE